MTSLFVTDNKKALENEVLNKQINNQSNKDDITGEDMSETTSNPQQTKKFIYGTEYFLEKMGLEEYKLDNKNIAFPTKNWENMNGIIINFSEYPDGIKYQLGVRIKDSTATIYDFYNIITNKYDGKLVTYTFETEKAKEFINNFMLYKYKNKLDIEKNEIFLELRKTLNEKVDNYILGKDKDIEIDYIQTIPEHVKKILDEYKKCTTYNNIIKNDESENIEPNPDNKKESIEQKKYYFNFDDDKEEKKEEEKKVDEAGDDIDIPIIEKKEKISKIKPSEKKREIEITNKTSKKKKINKKHDDEENML